jgi:hypothetical protein
MDNTRGHYSGLLIHDPRVEVWEDETNVSEAGAHPGRPTTTSSRLALACLRVELDADLSDDIRLHCHRGGLPAPAPGGRPGTFVWDYASDSAGTRRGWNPPTTISDYDPVIVGSGSLETKNPTMCITSTGRLLLAFEATDGTDRTIRTYKRDPGENAFSLLNAVAVTGLEETLLCFPCLVAVEDRVVCYYWRHDATLGNATIGAHVSADDGATFDLMAKTATGTFDQITGTGFGVGAYEEVHRLAAAYRSGEILLMASMRRTTSTPTNNVLDTYRQYASSDGGHALTLVNEWADAADRGGRFPHVRADVDGFHFVHLVLAHLGSSGSYQGTNTTAEHRAVGTAYAPLERATASSIPWESFGSTAVTSTSELEGKIDDGVIGYTIDETGRHWIHGVQSWSVLTDGRAAVSEDRGRTWQAAEGDGASSPEGWWSSGDEDLHPVDLETIAFEGRIVMACGHVSPTTGRNLAQDASITALGLGGYTTVCRPPVDGGDLMTQRSAHKYTWLPFEWPEAHTGVTASGAGTITEDMTTGRMVGTSASDSQFKYYEDSFAASDPAGGIAGECTVATSDSRPSFDEWFQPAYLDCVLSDGTEGYGFRITVEGTQLHVSKKTGSAAFALLGSHSVTASTHLDVKWVMYGDQLRVWHRPAGGPVQTWTETATYTLDDIGGDFATGRIQWGYLLDTGDSVTWSRMAYSQYAAESTAKGRIKALVEASNPADLLGRDYSSRSTYVTESVSVRAENGPARPGDLHTVATAHDFGAERTLEVSPRRQWRSTSTTDADRFIAWRWSSLGNSSIGGDFLGTFLADTNLTDVEVDLHDGAWAAFYNDDAAAITSLSFTRNGDTVESTTSVRSNEYDGGFVALSSSVSRRITRNTGGNATMPASFVLEDVAVSDPASGTGKVYGRHRLILIPLEGDRYRGVRLKLPVTPTDQAPPEDHWYIGSVVIGPVIVHGDETSWGRVIEVGANVETDTLRDRTRHTRRLGRPLRSVRINWADGLDTRLQVGGGYHKVETSGGEAVALTGATADDLMGVLEMQDGPHRPCVYIPRILSGDNTAWTTRGHRYRFRRDEYLHARMSGTIRLESVQGTEEYVDDGEVVRVVNVTLEEIR